MLLLFAQRLAVVDLNGCIIQWISWNSSLRAADVATDESHVWIRLWQPGLALPGPEIFRSTPPGSLMEAHAIISDAATSARSILLITLVAASRSRSGIASSESRVTASAASSCMLWAETAVVLMQRADGRWRTKLVIALRMAWRCRSERVPEYAGSTLSDGGD